MKKKRVWALILSLVMVTASVSGCGSAAKKESTGSTAQSTAAVSEAAQSTAAEQEAAQSAAAEQAAASAAEQAVESISQAETVSLAEDSIVNAASDAGGLSSAEAVFEVSEAEETASAVERAADAAESIAESSAEEMETIAVTEENALSEAWRQISEKAVDLLTVCRESLQEAVEQNASQKSAFRISIDPDALQILGLASETFLKTDLSWVKEIGLDIVSSAQASEKPLYPFAQMAADVPDVKYLSPGGSLSFHVNEEEIATADWLMDEANMAFRMRLPELVSGEYIDPSVMQSYVSAFGSSLRNVFGNSVNSMIMPPFSTRQQVMRTIAGMIPDPDAFRTAFDTVKPVFDSAEIVSAEESAVSAGSVSEPCTSYTGRVPARALPESAELLLDRLETDEAFRTELLECLDSYYEEYNGIPGIAQLRSLLIHSPLRNSAYIRNFYNILYPTSLSSTLDVDIAVYTGKWSFREGAFEAAEQRVKKAEEEAEETGEEAESVYDPRQLTIVPGKAYTREEYDALPYEQKSLMSSAVMRGDVILDEKYSFGEKVWLWYGWHADEIRETLKDAKESIPDDAAFEIGVSFNGDGILKGLSCDGVQVTAASSESGTTSAAEAVVTETADANRYRFFEICWPQVDLNGAFGLILYNGTETSQAALTIEILAEESSPRREINASLEIPEAGLFTLTCLNDPDEGMQSLQGEISTRYPDQHYSFNASHTKDAGSEAENYRVLLQDSGITEPLFSLDIAKVPDGTKDVWSGNAVAGGTTVGTLEGFYDHEDGRLSFEASMPVDNRTTLSAEAEGVMDTAAGDGELRFIFKESTIFESGLSTIKTPSARIIVTAGIEGLKKKEDGGLSGIVKLSAEASGRYINLPIPKGLMLILDFNENAVRIGDESGTYFSVTQLEESEYMPYERSDARLQEMCGDEYSSYMRSLNFDSNWNLLIVINRLLKAGMPQDFLKEMPLEDTDLMSALEDYFYQLFG